MAVAQAVEPLEPPFTELLEAEMLVNSLVGVPAEVFLEVFGGDKIITLNILIKRLPAVVPWDCKHGPRYNVVEQGYLLVDLAAAKRISGCHIATPCQSQTLGRDPQLRNLDNVTGFRNLTARQRSLVDAGTFLALFSIFLAMAIDDNDGFVSIENPLWSWLWFFAQMITLWCRAGFAAVIFPQQQYGTDYEKLTCVTHNSPTLHRLNHGLKLPPPTVVLRGMVWYKGAWVWRTALSSAYPPALGDDYAELHREALQLRHQARLTDQPMPRASFEHDQGLPST